jgi:hypothetical protein
MELWYPGGRASEESGPSCCARQRTLRYKGWKNVRRPRYEHPSWLSSGGKFCDILSNLASGSLSNQGSASTFADLSLYY